MNTQHLFAFSLLSIASSVSAQPVSFESVRLADLIMESGWSTVEESLPLIIAGFESQLKAKGVTERATRVFGEEVRLALSRDNLSRAYAVAVTSKFTPEEILEVSSFLQSKSGKKYLSLSRDFLSNPQYLQPMAKQACNGAGRRLEEGTDRASIGHVCSRL